MTDGLDARHKDLADCVSRRSSPSDAAVCLDRLSPEMAKARRVAECLSARSAVNEPTNAATCIANQVGGDSAQIARCLGQQDKTAIAICLMGDKTEVHVAQRVYKCVSQGIDTSSLIANCTEGLLDAKTSQTVACVHARAPTESSWLPVPLRQFYRRMPHVSSAARPIARAQLPSRYAPQVQA